MVQGARLDTYLVAVEQKREPVRLYALLAGSEAEALEIVTAKAIGGTHVEVAGRLSRRIAKGYRLKPGDLILV